MKDPALLFYPGDWLGGTMGMTFEEKGAYMELLMLQFNRGHMTSHMIGHVLGQQHGQIWDKLKDKFEIDEAGMYFNRRLDEEKNKRKSYTNSRKNNKTGANQYSKKKKDDLGHMTSHTLAHMENESEDININTNPSGKEGVGEKPNPNIPAYETFLKEALIAAPDVDENHVRITFENWVNNGWKDANSKPIKNWKSLLLYCAPSLKKKNVTPAGPVIIGRQTEEIVNNNFNAFMGNGQ